MKVLLNSACLYCPSSWFDWRILTAVSGRCFAAETSARLFTELAAARIFSLNRVACDLVVDFARYSSTSTLLYSIFFTLRVAERVNAFVILACRLVLSSFGSGLTSRALIEATREPTFEPAWEACFDTALDAALEGQEGAFWSAAWTSPS